MLAAMMGVLLLAAPMFSQTANGRISGTVKDQTGGTIAGAAVVVTDVARGLARTLTTDEAGAYLAPNLLPGMYSVRSTFMGFQAWERTNINLGVGGDLAIDVVLQPGAQTQTVTITEQLPMINTTSATLGGSLDSATILDLPLNSRNFKNLLDLRPGTVTNLGNNTTVATSGGSQSVNGLRNDSSQDFRLEGLPALDIYTGQSIIGNQGPRGDGNTVLPPEVIQEYSQQFNTKSEFGWKAGATVNVGLKSGTNTLHGTAYSFFRDAHMDARDYFNVASQSKVNGAMQQFGAMVGGPVKKDKLFFLLGYEQDDLANGSSAVANVPFTDPGMIANFPACITSGPGGTNTCAAIANSVAGTRTPDASNHFILACLGVPAASRSPQSLSLLGLNSNCTPGSTYPNATSGATWFVPHGGTDHGASADPASALTSYFANSQTQGRTIGAVAKVDYTLNTRNSINAFVYTGNGTNDGEINKTDPIWRYRIYQTPLMIGGTWTWFPNSSWANTFRVGKVNIFTYYRGLDVIAGKSDAELGLPTGVPTDTSLAGPGENLGYPQSFTVAGFTALGSNHTEIRKSNNTEVSDQLNYLRGNHSFRFGTELVFTRQSGGIWENSRGAFTFGRVADSTGQGNGLLSFIAGQNAILDNIPGSQDGFCPSPGVIVGVSPNATCVGAAMIRTQPTGLESASLFFGNPEYHVKRGLYAFYFQDDWRIRPRLTLNLGLRYDIITVPTDRDNHLGGFDPAQGLVQEGLQIDKIHKADHNNFGPRLGFAWDMFGSGKTVVRGGGSIIYELLPFRAYSDVGNTPGIPSTPTGWIDGCTVNTRDPVTGLAIANPAPAGSPLVTNCQGLGGALITPGGTRNVGQVDFSRTASNILDIVHWDGIASGTFPSIFPGPEEKNCSPLISIRDNPASLTSSVGAGCSVVSADPNLSAAYVETWTLSIQHAILNNLVLDLAYVGNHGTKLIGRTDDNQAPPGSGWTPALINTCLTTMTAANCNGTAANSNALTTAARPYANKFPYLNTILRVWNADTSNYNGLQVTLTARNFHGLSLISGYTWSKSLDVNTVSFSGVGTDSYNNSLDYGRGANDIRHRFTLSAIYQIPGRAGYHGLLQGYKLNGIFRYQTGTPWAPAANGDFAGTNGTTRWDFFGKASDFDVDYQPSGGADAVFHPAGTTVPSGINPRTGVAYVAADLAINTPLCSSNARSAATLQALGCWTRKDSAIIPPPPNSFGNMARNLFSGPRYLGLDMSVTKTQKITERFSAEFRAESFNTLNHPAFSTPGTNIASCTTDSCSFGLSTSTPPNAASNSFLGSGGPRRIQFGAKFIF